MQKLSNKTQQRISTLINAIACGKIMLTLPGQPEQAGMWHNHVDSATYLLWSEYGIELPNLNKDMKLSDVCYI